jgi:hypothetical protein
MQITHGNHFHENKKNKGLPPDILMLLPRWTHK